MLSVATTPPGSLVPPSPDRLTAPRADSRLVERDRLLQRIGSRRASAIQLVHAPPGYGKTTLLGQLAARERRAVAWLSLQSRDNDPVTLLGDLACALDLAEECARDDLLDWPWVGAPTDVSLGLRIFADVVARSKMERLIVLDDVHRVTGRAALNVVQALIANLPNGSTLAMASRARPGLPIARLRVDGRLDEIRAMELRMTASEGSQLLRRAGADVDDEEARRLVRHTEGWPAALYLAALALRERSAPPAIALHVPAVELADYFHEQVLVAASRAQREFLVRTSVLDELHPPLCDAVLERTDSADQLRALLEANMFVFRAESGHCYRVHELVRENLLADLRREPELERVLHLRASAWWARANDPERAIRHALAAGETAVAADLVWSMVIPNISGGRVETMARWLSWFDPADVCEIPALRLAAGWVALEQGREDDAAAQATVLLRLPDDTVLADGVPVRAVALLLTITTGQIAVEGAAGALAEAESLLRARVPPDSPWWALARATGGCMALMRGKTDLAGELLREGQALAAGRLPTVHSLCVANLALLALRSGDVNTACAHIERAHGPERILAPGSYPSQVLTAAVGALVRVRMGDRDRGRDDALAAERVLAAIPTVVAWLAAQTRIVLAEAFAGTGEASTARRLLEEARSFAAGEPDVTWLRSEAARVAGTLAEHPAAAPQGSVLTAAELRTLQYLPTHLTLREIGELLCNTRNTVKTHTIAIYRKLEVRSRSEAVARGRELGLLDPLDAPGREPVVGPHRAGPR